MNEQNNTRKDAIDINDFVYAATGARVRRLTMPDGTHWFPATDVLNKLGYRNPQKTLTDHVPTEHRESLETVTGGHGLSIPAGREWRRDMNLVDLQGLIRLVNGCTKPSARPFKAWVSEVIVAIQRDGSYSLEPAVLQPTPTTVTAYAVPQQLADALVRLEQRVDRQDEALRQIDTKQNAIVDLLRDITQTLRHTGDRTRQVQAPELTPQQLLSNWKSRNLVVTEDVHKVAAHLAPALLHGGANYSVEEISVHTELSPDRVRHSLKLLSKQGCVREAGRTPDDAPFYVLP
ncbi:Bro-N domain-containing protein [Streptomyces sp. WI04-05B]|uniref:BRO-N domain-containing protein n=2 Tax=Streptomyces TaxID=1883 RepID=UPI0029B7FFDD|nr:Bro-N domain-containing protein [Streptomyces sp. AK08-02]MDX2548408.1 Bro-N domain-containing protein [Streptomyces sp. WI04-05B]MDX2590344.1 Bro-N domain-containing protein [Streptomyces sp. WI04-05A]MDX3751944.1 Bro-N domain-containing protein [Streptomyces sp. AK08-02]